ncbi:hypothetical protein ACRS52_21260 [Bacillus cytotoxicus]|uniref:hypothetical protein n=1 Tax=Bacillus cytotoxicus TaxID=580165 RepID=UPI000B351C5F|nr:hypothetical protein [Bacillus cytotoxicus]QTR73037.1 hypothetical protein JC775_20385 [Bacillus cytotoxicus]QTR81095.1 hypothetical protein JC777_00110 [Bacillus cytotoxicus]QTR85199.1 hypothetical protein JC774_00110 [Bacillus cytotoxicus]HDR4573547.1 hypothetical protein [Bacillus cytotoxicus]HDR4589626.1 hypothetical protein [Bacillus cytotoxicus]
MGIFDRVSDKIPKSDFTVQDSHMGTLFREFGYAWNTFKIYAFVLLGCAFAFFLIRKLKHLYADE